tara:strand:- start:410 stop:586 length:177 start_codon:yes stop_codon:yes gene_type:complete
VDLDLTTIQYRKTRLLTSVMGRHADDACIDPASLGGRGDKGDAAMPGDDVIHRADLFF